MSYGFKYECDLCSFKSEEIILEGWKGLFICDVCKEIVIANIAPYKYDSTNCPLCKKALFLKDRMNNFEKNLCPRCGDKALSITQRTHYLKEKSIESLLKEGQLVQGEFLGLSYRKNSGLINLVHGGKARIVEGFEDLEIGAYIECEVIDVMDNIYFCKVRFIRVLDIEQY